jgi:FHS family L-fucose permease-like MFS transporter
MPHERAASSPKKGLSPIIIVGILFFIFGFITWLNGILIPYLKIACQLNNFEAYLVTTAFYIAYLIMAWPSSVVLRLIGFKKGMAAGLVIIGLGALIFIPAALTREYWIFLTGLFVQGTGLAILQSASNPYITILGPAESAAKRISIMGIFNKVAGVIAPLILGAIALKGADQLTKKLVSMDAAEKATELNELASRVILPYAVIVVALLLLSVFIYYSGLPEIDENKEDTTAADAGDKRTSIFQFPHLLLGVVALFLYVGAEVLAGDSIVIYGISQKIALSTARFFTSCTLVCMIAGYVVGIIAIPRFIKQQKALVISAILGLLFASCALIASGWVSVMFIALLGLANSLMWPAIWPLALAHLGKFTKVGSSLLVMGIAGAAIIPLFYGRLADLISSRAAYVILLPIYAFILYYAASGHNAGLKRYIKSEPIKDTANH